MEMIEERVCDGGILRLIGKWINVGVIEDGRLLHSETGMGQGQVISPLLANIYLHYVLDEWFETVVKPRLKGEAYEVRFADDFILCFQYREDAEKVLEALKKRFEKYGLTLHPDKTRLMAFGRQALAGSETGWAEASHIRFSRIHAHLYAKPEGIFHDSCANDAQAATPQFESGDGMVSRASA